MGTWQIISMALAAILVGGLVLVLVQLRTTLRQVDRRLKSTGRRVDRTLDETKAAVERINRLLGGLDGREQDLGSLFTSMGRLAQTLDRVRGTITIASAVGAAVTPAMIALVRSLAEQRAVSAERRDDSQDTKGNGRDHASAGSVAVTAEER
jgi:uncharacterized protein YoxC